MGISLRDVPSSDPSWEILKIVITGDDVDLYTPQNVGKKSAIWDNRASYTYG